jgi:hypothetical protein
MFPAGTFEVRKGLSTLCLAKPSWEAEEILKTYELFIYEDLHCCSN